MPEVSETLANAAESRVGKKPTKYSETAQMMAVSRWEKRRSSVPQSPEETDKAGRKALCQALLIRGYA